MSDEQQHEEPPDHYQYQVMFYAATIRFFIAAVTYYRDRLNSDIAMIQSYPEFEAILDQEVLRSYPLAKELDFAERVLGHLNHVVEMQGEDEWDYEIRISHGRIRFIKSAVELYVSHLQVRRDELASQNISSLAIDALDQQIAGLREKVTAGVFEHASPHPLAVLPGRLEPSIPAVADESPPPAARPRPVVLETIEVRDAELRSRCLDLLAQFKEDGQYDRLDTVLSEATRILEDRLRSLVGAPSSLIGKELVSHVFAGDSPLLVLSDDNNEQKSAHLLYLGTFGFIRNVVHHRLVGELQPERVLQLVGLIDYLVHLAETARRTVADSSEPVV